MINITGQLTQATQEREALRFSMRTAKAAMDKAQYKREFRKARNKVEFIKRNQKEKI